MSSFCYSAKATKPTDVHLLPAGDRQSISGFSPCEWLPQRCTCHWGLCEGFPQFCGHSHFLHYIFFLAQAELYSFAFLTIYSKDLTAFLFFFTKAQIGSLTGFNNSHSIDVKSGVSYKCTMLLWCSFIDQRANKSTEGIQGCSHSGEMSRTYHLGRFQHLHCRDPTWKKRITLKIRNPHFSKTSDVPEVMRTHKT